MTTPNLEMIINYTTVRDQVCRRSTWVYYRSKNLSSQLIGSMLFPWLTGSAQKAVRCYSQQLKMASKVNAHIQILGTGANELAPSFYLFTDSKRYVFNCGENFQRFRSEFRSPLTKMSFFITHVSWKNLGGFAGVAMSARDNGVPKIPLYGPELIEEFTELTRYFTGRKKITLLTPWSKEGSKCMSSDVYEDENVHIKTVPLFWRKRSASDGSGDETMTACPKPKRTKLANDTAAFVCKLSDVRGKFDVEKAKALGIPPGPLYKKLAEGESVTTSDDRVIHSHQVLGSPRLGPVMITIECPNENYIESVLSNPALSNESFSATNQTVALIVHMSPASVIKTKRYQDWMTSFGSSTKHLILNEEMCPPEFGLRRYLKLQIPLNLMNPAVYHPLLTSVRPDVPELDRRLSGSIVYGRTLLKYHLKPSQKAGIDNSTVLEPLSGEYKQHLQEIADNKQLLDAIESSQLNKKGRSTTRLDQRAILKPPDKLLVSAATEVDNPIITFLGTGSSAPTSYRSVSGILIQTASSGNILLDCGEGSLSQVYRCFGKEAGDNVIRNISGMFLSHIHGDHHLGVLSVLLRQEELRGSRGDPPLVIAPDILLNWLRHYSKTVQRVSYRSTDCKILERDMATTDAGKLKQLEFETVQVLHCKSAYGVVVKHSTDWSIVYSGDTRPCQGLVEAGRGTSLLIHEATFEDNLIEDAKAKMHSTFGEALEISSKMGAKFTLMTHFSCRYPRIPTVLMDERFDSKVGVAFDCMSVRLKELNSLYSDLPALKKIFTHVTDESDEVQTVSIQDWGEEVVA